MRAEDISDEHLLFIVGETDARLFSEGKEIRQRSFEVPIAVMRQFGYVDVVLEGHGRAPLLDRIESAYRQIYRPHDLAMGGHIGVVMFRDVFIRIGIPHVYGRCALDPFEHMDLTPVQRRILNSEENTSQKFIDQFLDVLDIQYGFFELKVQNFPAQHLVGFIQNALFHLHGAAAVLTGGYDHRGAIQSSLIATELALKAGAAAAGMTEKEIKEQFGHGKVALLKFIGKNFHSMDQDRIYRVLVGQPSLVENRYNAEQPKRREAGELAMGAQYIVSEIMRQLSLRNIRAENPSTSARTYPG